MAPWQPLEGAIHLFTPQDAQFQPLIPRNLQHPTHTQAVTLGVIGGYVVAIAILWNVPYLRMILWPFKVFISNLESSLCFIYTFSYTLLHL
jgi:hypothetical protein